VVNVTVLVRDGNVAQALKALHKKLEREGVIREMKARHYIPPSAQRRQKQKRARSRAQRKAVVQHEAGARNRPQGRRLTRIIRKGRGRALAAARR
jgi:small subunit ribosomal protein S21